jgi:hypothetical protein
MIARTDNSTFFLRIWKTIEELDERTESMPIVQLKQSKSAKM